MFEYLIPFAATAVSAGISLYGGYKEREAGKDNARLMREETTESLKRLKKTQDRNVSAMRARAAASGVKVTGSQAKFIKSKASEYESERKWMAKVGASRAEIARETGDTAAWMGAGKAFSTAATGASGYF